MTVKQVAKSPELWCRECKQSKFAGLFSKRQKARTDKSRLCIVHERAAATATRKRQAVRTPDNASWRRTNSIFMNGNAVTARNDMDHDYFRPGNSVARKPAAPFKFQDGIETGTVVSVSSDGRQIRVRRDGLTRRGQPRQATAYSAEFWMLLRR